MGLLLSPAFTWLVGDLGWDITSYHFFALGLHNDWQPTSKERIKERGWKILFPCEQGCYCSGSMYPLASLGTFEELVLVELRTLQLLHASVFWCLPSPHSHLHECRIHLQAWGRQPAFLIPQEQCVPQAAFSPLLSSGWLPGGVVWDICGYSCCTYLTNMLSVSPFSGDFSFKSVLCCISWFRFYSQ